ncbi:uncharacterized protein TM35_000211770 [Trypanosoma theileri]|uniref:Uncharacterized protein n=1 Tax=Trypanosoma theileri TaxID=67003 RepID=A0A1X0NSJ8_9TRYP|nr:uncharacterized protein TM35_000211770 [Trypanosoma theileri]ORC87571.1 hypothetical protein TM35_000211770 [Trypanosoma theileri]
MRDTIDVATERHSRWQSGLKRFAELTRETDEKGERNSFYHRKRFGPIGKFTVSMNAECHDIFGNNGNGHVCNAIAGDGGAFRDKPGQTIIIALEGLEHFSRARIRRIKQRSAWRGSRRVDGRKSQL